VVIHTVNTGNQKEVLPVVNVVDTITKNISSS